MSEHPASMIPAFDQRNGIRWVMTATRKHTCTPSSGCPDSAIKVQLNRELADRSLFLIDLNKNVSSVRGLSV